MMCESWQRPDDTLKACATSSVAPAGATGLARCHAATDSNVSPSRTNPEAKRKYDRHREARAQSTAATRNAPRASAQPSIKSVSLDAG